MKHSELALHLKRIYASFRKRNKELAMDIAEEMYELSDKYGISPKSLFSLLISGPGAWNGIPSDSHRFLTSSVYLLDSSGLLPKLKGVLGTSPSVRMALKDLAYFVSRLIPMYVVYNFKKAALPSVSKISNALSVSKEDATLFILGKLMDQLGRNSLAHEDAYPNLSLLKNAAF